MNFEYDPRKSTANKAKHGIDFEESKLVWQDADVVLLESAYSAEKSILQSGVSTANSGL